MPDEPSHALLSKATFKKGDIGWATAQGVVHPQHFRPAENPDAYLVRACEDCEAGATGKFEKTWK
jgi:hypothetical protein